jgi:hypothetical protein
MPDVTFRNADTNDADLQNFFSRPIKVESYSWGVGQNIFEQFNPWQLFFENKRVINRISNYNLLRCKLKVKFVINGNGFYYGRAIASYTPLQNLDVFTKDRAFFIQDVVAASQRPHIYLDPTTSQGGTLTLPFCWYENALRIPSQEWRDMGDIHIHGMQLLKHANEGTDPISISIFVWAEEVSLSIPTANEPGALAPQLGEIFHAQAGDEYGNGPISKPAGTLAKVAGALESIPPIAPFAKATQIAASAVSNVASMFGYSRPVDLADIKPYKPTYMGNMANTNVPDTSTKLSLDAKQELTIDPRTFGLGGSDEMTIKSIAMRESYLTTFNWPVSSVSEQILWNTEVSPVLWNELPGPPDELHFPACCFATLPFKYWRGTIKFRFQIVASAFHKGRMKISYDPSFPLSNEYNTNYIHIIDLAKERDFTVAVGWGQERSLVTHRHPGVNAVPWSIAPLTSDPGLAANGILSVHVVNKLTVPNSTANNDIRINVFVSAGDDFEVFVPDSEDIEDFVYFAPQTEPEEFDSQVGEIYDSELSVNTALTTLSTALVSLVLAFLTRLYNRIERHHRDISVHILQSEREIFNKQMAEKDESHPDADLTKAEDEPMKMEASTEMAASMSPSDYTSCVFIGDPVTSFRQCLKRYAYHTSYFPIGAEPKVMLNLNNSNFPYYRGYAPQAVDQCAVPTYPTSYNYCHMTLLNYITPAFTCRRGGLRWKYLREGATRDNIMIIKRNANSAGFFRDENGLSNASQTQDTRKKQAVDEFYNLWDGAHITHVANNPVLEAELPYYDNVRFTSGKIADVTSGYFPGTDMHFHLLKCTWQVAEDESPAIHSFVSVGEDFQLGFFTGAPVVWRLPWRGDPSTL